MYGTPAVSRPAWMMALSGGRGGDRRSPVEIVATAATYVIRTPAAHMSGLHAGRFGRWTDGVIAMRGDGMLFVREDAVETAWSAVDGVTDRTLPLHEYQPGTWGPPEADALAADIGGWHNPE